MKQDEYMKAVLQKINPDRTITCEDCGNKDMVGHMVIDHEASTVKAVCHSCFVTKYQNALYGKGHKA
jgi:transcription elongation factor Elf1